MRMEKIGSLWGSWDGWRICRQWEHSGWEGKYWAEGNKWNSLRLSLEQLLLPHFMHDLISKRRSPLMKAAAKSLGGKTHAQQRARWPREIGKREMNEMKCSHTKHKVSQMWTHNKITWGKKEGKKGKLKLARLDTMRCHTTHPWEKGEGGCKINYSRDCSQNWSRKKSFCFSSLWYSSYSTGTDGWSRAWGRNNIALRCKQENFGLISQQRVSWRSCGL